MPRDVDWPIQPDASGDVTPIGLLIAQSHPSAPHAQLLVSKTKELISDEDASEFQFVVRSPALGPVTLPCLARKKNGATIVFYSHAGPWDDGDVERLRRWAARARSAQGLHEAKIEVIADHDKPPAAHDIVSQRPRSVLGLMAEPRLDEADPGKNAELLVELMKKIHLQDLSFDENGLLVLDTFMEQTLGAVANDFAFRHALTLLIGSFLGETVVRTFGGRWIEPIEDQPGWMKHIKVGGLRLNPLKRAAQHLGKPGGREGLVDFYDHAWERAGKEKAELSRTQKARVSAAGVSTMSIDEITEKGRQRIYRILAFLALSDGVIHDAERVRLEETKDRFGLDDATTRALEEEAAAKKNMKISSHAAEREFLMVAMPDIVAADGVLDKKEEKRLRSLGDALNVNAKQMISWLKAMLEARAAERGG